MNRAELLKALEIIKPGTDDKDKANLGQDNCLFNEDTVSAFNNEIAITYPINSALVAMIRAADLIALLKKMKKLSSTVTLTSDGKQMHVTTVDSKHTLSVLNDDVVEERLKAVHSSASSLKWMALPDNFVESVAICALAASKKESQFTLACVYADGVNMLASDNDKVAWATLTSPVKKLLVKASAVKNIVAINPIEYSGDKAFYHFRSADGAMVSVRRVTGEYPVEYIDFFKFDGNKFSIPSKALDGMDMMSVFIDEKSPTISVEVKPGRCIISNANSRGSSKFKVDITYKGDPFNFFIGHEVFSEMLKYNTDITVGDNVAKIISEDGAFKMLTTLIME